MALIFSTVSLKSEGKEVEFLIGGIPEKREDLFGWTAYEVFMDDINPNSSVEVSVSSYRYGEEENFNATPEEIAYFMKRIEMKSDFIKTRTQNISKSQFLFNR